MKVLLEKNRNFAIITLVMVIFFSPLPAQYKVGYRIGLGIGFTKPDKFNDSLAEQEMSKIGSAWFPLNYDLSVNIYPSLRVGYKKLSTRLITYNRSSGDYILPIVYRGIMAESYFTFWKRFEANFGFSPMYGKAVFMNKKLTASDETLGVESSTTAEITNSAFGFYSWVGMRMYLLSFVSVEGSVGYMYSKFGDKWKAKKGSSNFSGGINMTKPFLRVAAVVGW
tara:strand:+ start:441 stop:1112 length:672 start_codon:yes stop_codon:yes gene_type:complete